jgi:hypothetical protein
MDSTAIVIKDAMAVYGFHLNDFSGSSPISLFDFLLWHLECSNHALPVLFIERNGGLSVTAVTASCAGKNLRY